jgi:hypothetical protein
LSALLLATMIKTTSMTIPAEQRGNEYKVAMLFWPVGTMAWWYFSKFLALVTTPPRHQDLDYRQAKSTRPPPPRPTPSPPLKEVPRSKRMHFHIPATSKKPESMRAPSPQAPTLPPAKKRIMPAKLEKRNEPTQRIANPTDSALED